MQGPSTHGTGRNDQQCCCSNARAYSWSMSSVSQQPLQYPVKVFGLRYLRRPQSEKQYLGGSVNGWSDEVNSLNASCTLGTGGRQEIDKQMVANGKLVDSRVSSIESLFTSQVQHNNYMSFIPTSLFCYFENASQSLCRTPFSQMQSKCFSMHEAILEHPVLHK